MGNFKLRYRLGSLLTFFFNILISITRFIIRYPESLFCNAFAKVGDIPYRSSMPKFRERMKRYYSAIGSFDPHFVVTKTGKTVDTIELIPLQSTATNNAAIIKTAYNLIQFAKLAYEYTNTAKSILKEMGFAKDQYKMIDIWGTSAIVCASSNFIVVSFRGTEPFSVTDWLTNYSYRMRGLRNPERGEGVTSKEQELPKAHHGFLDALEVDGLGVQEYASWLQIREVVRNFLVRYGSNTPVWVTGHSLGGSLATLFVQKMIDMRESHQLAGLFTFGNPRAGNLQFAREFNSVVGDRTFRFVLGSDLVPRLPVSYTDKRNNDYATRPYNFAFMINKWLRESVETPQEYVHVGHECRIDKRSFLIEILPLCPEPIHGANFKGVQPKKRKQDQRNTFKAEVNGSGNHPQRRRINILRTLARWFLPEEIANHFPGEYADYISQSKIRFVQELAN